jgi:glucokinase
LGVAGLVNMARRWIPVPGEGGHVDMGPRSRRDEAIFPHIERIDGRVSAEQLLCGRGIVNIYRAVCLADGQDITFSTPAEITRAGLSGQDAQARETLALFATYLGRCAGDMALIFMAQGGVYLAGGIPQRIEAALAGPEFRAGFEDKAPHQALMRAMPTFILTDPLAALSGLAAYARTPALFGVGLEGRYWKA